MTESSIYGSTRELMTATDAIEKASSSGDVTFKRRSLISRQRSCQSFEMGSRKIDQVTISKLSFLFTTQVYARLAVVLTCVFIAKLLF